MRSRLRREHATTATATGTLEATAAPHKLIRLLSSASLVGDHITSVSLFCKSRLRTSNGSA